MRKPTELAQVAEQIQAILEPLTESERLSVIIMVGLSAEDEDESPSDYCHEEVQDETGQYEVFEGISDLRAIEAESIRHALKRNEWNKHLAAQDLGISERTLYRKMREYDL